MKNRTTESTENLLNAIEKIVSLIENSESNDVTFNLFESKVEKESINTVKSFFDLTTKEAVFFSIIFYFQIQENFRTSLKGLAEFLKIPTLDMYKMYEVIDSLFRKGIVVINENGSEDKFRIKKKIFKQILRMEIPEISNETKSAFKLAQKVYNHLENNRYGHNNGEIIYYIEKEIDDYGELEELERLKTVGLNFQEQVIFLYVAYCSIIENRTTGINSVAEYVYGNINDLIRFRKSLLEGTSILIRKKLLNHEPNSFLSSEAYSLGEIGLNIMEMAPVTAKAAEFKTKIGTILNPDKIKTIDLYYNEREAFEIKNFKKLLRESNYKKCLKKLKEKNLSPGITMMLFGFPGTGKTELVYQISKITGRKVLMVDMASIRDKFVGESEKRVVTIFEEYERFKKIEKKTPILLMNECDALLGKRTAVQGSVDQMNNTMQNVFLQKIEDFEGILMATSNLMGNLDKAFERRFLFKIKVDKPELAIRVKILQQRFPEMDKSFLKDLAKKYHLTGAQIENVSRRWTMDNLFNKGFDSKRFEQLIEQELMKPSRKTKAKGQIGFVKLMDKKMA